MPRNSTKRNKQTNRGSGTGKADVSQRVSDFLGEEDLPDSNEEEEVEDDGSFQSADADENQTDYQLEYSQSRPRNSPRKPIVSDRNPARHQETISPIRQTRQNTSASAAETADDRSEKKKRKQQLPKKRGVWREIRKLQATTNLLISRLPFSRVVREIFTDVSSQDLRITPSALQALQEATEMYTVQLFQDAYMCTLHRSRKTLMPKDMALARFIRGRSDPGNR